MLIYFAKSFGGVIFILIFIPVIPKILPRPTAFFQQVIQNISCRAMKRWKYMP